MLQGQAAPKQAAGSGTEDEDKCADEEGQVRARGWQEEVVAVRAFRVVIACMFNDVYVYTHV